MLCLASYSNYLYPTKLETCNDLQNRIRRTHASSDLIANVEISRRNHIKCVSEEKYDLLTAEQFVELLKCGESFSNKEYKKCVEIAKNRFKIPPN